jgi:hypothetical protein
VSEQEYLQFVTKNVLEWTSQEKAVVQAAWETLVPQLEKFSLPFPDTIYFVKTTGDEEGGAEYTRSNAIILPSSALAPTGDSLRGTIAHELFHVLSRHSPALREKLYAVIGFQPCGEIPFPPGLAPRKITNPDAPRNDHCIRLQAGQESVWAVPILFSKSPRYDISKKGPFFDYLEMKFLVVQKTGDSAATYDASDPRLLDVSEVRGFFEQVGRNTDYIIHPEEILADNFEFLLIGKSSLPSPEVQRNLAAALSSR